MKKIKKRSTYVVNMQTNLAINALLNAVKNSLSIIFPLITYPYLFRILQVDGIGKVNYSSAIINYFILFAGLGISTYATREGAKFRDKDDKIEFQKFVNEIFTINIFSTIFSYILLFFLLYKISAFDDYKNLILIYSLSIAFTTMGIEWINNIFEDFLFITIRTIIINLINLILLFLFIKKEGDYYYYAILTVASNGLICICNWVYCRKYITPRICFKINFRKHILPVITLFANSIAVTIYVNSDIIILGLMCGNRSVGLYECAVKIYSVLKKILASVYIVVIPRMSKFIQAKDFGLLKETFTKIVSTLITILLPISTGIIVLAKEIIFVIGGIEYIDATWSLIILCIALIGAIIGGAITFCLNIPLCREGTNVKATIISAIINVVLNIFLVPKFQHYGAAVTTLIAEFFVLLFCIIKEKDLIQFIDLEECKETFCQALIGCVSMITFSFFVKFYIDNMFLSLLLILILGGGIYLIELIFMKNYFILKILNIVVKKVTSYRKGK